MKCKIKKNHELESITGPFFPERKWFHLRKWNRKWRNTPIHFPSPKGHELNTLNEKNSHSLVDILI